MILDVKREKKKSPGSTNIFFRLHPKLLAHCSLRILYINGVKMLSVSEDIRNLANDITTMKV